MPIHIGLDDPMCVLYIYTVCSPDRASGVLKYGIHPTNPKLVAISGGW